MRVLHVINLNNDRNPWNTDIGGTMKKTIQYILIVFFSLSTLGYASPFVPSHISEVTLFSNQAMVVREGQRAV